MEFFHKDAKAGELNTVSYASNGTSDISMNAVGYHSSISVEIPFRAIVTDGFSENLLRFRHWSHADPKVQSEEDIDFGIKCTSMSRPRSLYRQMSFNSAFSGQ